MFPKAIQNLIDHISKLPTVGPKTAERYVYYLLKQSDSYLQEFAQSIAELKEKTIKCGTCHKIAGTNPCEICSDKNRDRQLLCVVSTDRDLFALEHTKSYNGLYHVLGGDLDAIKGVNIADLKIDDLVNRLKNHTFKEIILATNLNFEGESTALHLIQKLKPFNIKITRLSRGLPMGSHLEYADKHTISNSLKYRSKI